MLEGYQRVKPFKYVTRFVHVHACTVTPQTEAATRLIVEIRTLPPPFIGLAGCVLRGVP